MLRSREQVAGRHYIARQCTDGRILYVYCWKRERISRLSAVRTKLHWSWRRGRRMNASPEFFGATTLTRDGNVDRTRYGVERDRYVMYPCIGVNHLVRLYIMHYPELCPLFQSFEICQKHLLVHDTNILPPLNNTKIP